MFKTGEVGASELKKREKVVIANWKMNLGLQESLELAKSLKLSLCNEYNGEIAIAPNFISIKEVGNEIKDSGIKVAAQDVFWQEYGAYTGEVSANMLAEAGCKYIIIGHSERRQIIGETDDIVNKKIKAVLETDNLVPVVCIGESKDQKESGERKSFLQSQIKKAFDEIGLVDGKSIIIAYEPIWAIGSGEVMKPSEANEVHVFIKNVLDEIFGEELSQDRFRVIYGGSVKSENAQDLMEQNNIDGVLVGGASLDPEEFKEIIKKSLK